MREVIDIIDQILARLVRNVGFLLSLLPDRRCGGDDELSSGLVSRCKFKQAPQIATKYARRYLYRSIYLL